MSKFGKILLASTAVAGTAFVAYIKGRRDGFVHGAVEHAFWDHSGEHKDELHYCDFHKNADEKGKELADNTQWDGTHRWGVKK